MKKLIALLLLPSIAFAYISPITTTFSGSALFANGTVGAPSISFINSTDAGMYRIGANDIGMSVAGILGLELKKSAGSFVNIGMGSAASGADTAPLIVSRSIASSIVGLQVNNPHTDANSTAQFQAFSSAGNYGVLLGAYSDNSTVAPYVSAGVLRPTGSAIHMNIIGGAVSGGDVNVYTGNDFTAAGLTMTFNADHSATSVGGVQLATVASIPVCAVGLRGLTWVVRGGAGVGDSFQMCMKGTADTYSWVVIKAAP